MSDVGGALVAHEMHVLYETCIGAALVIRNMHCILEIAYISHDILCTHFILHVVPTFHIPCHIFHIHFIYTYVSCTYT